MTSKLLLVLAKDRLNLHLMEQELDKVQWILKNATQDEVNDIFNYMNESYSIDTTYAYRYAIELLNVKKQIPDILFASIAKDNVASLHFKEALEYYNYKVPDIIIKSASNAYSKVKENILHKLYYKI